MTQRLRQQKVKRKSSKSINIADNETKKYKRKKQSVSGYYVANGKIRTLYDND